MGPESPGDTAWLDDHEQQAWRAYLRSFAVLSAELHRRLTKNAGLTYSEFAVLVQLSEASDHRLRIFELAKMLQWERSRLSHQLTRMTKKGLVERDECTDDARGAFAVLLPAGLSAIEQASPGHAADVRELFIEPAGDDLHELGRAAHRIGNM